jgi:hypothetical protein
MNSASKDDWQNEYFFLLLANMAKSQEIHIAQTQQQGQQSKPISINVHENP